MRGCAVWSVPMLFAYGINRFSHEMAQLTNKNSPHSILLQGPCPTINKISKTPRHWVIQHHCPSQSAPIIKMFLEASILYIYTVNFLNIRTPKKFVVITLKFELCGSTIVMSLNNKDGMANSEDPDQTAPLGAVWSGSALFAQANLSENFGSLRCC